MAKKTVLKKVTVGELVGTKEEFAKLAEDWLAYRVEQIKKGRTLRNRKYKKSTVRLPDYWDHY